MSRTVILSPVLSRSGSAKIAQPRPVKYSTVILSPVCSQFSGAQTATPGIIGSQ